MRTSLAVVIALFAATAVADDDDFPAFICRIPLPGSECSEAPATLRDPPSCDDRQFDDALIENAANGDHSAVDLLQRRYAAASTYAERIRVGAAVLGRAADDSAIWKELAAYAEHVVEFHADGEKAADNLAAYCAKHDCEPKQYDRLARQAFEAIAGDRRARPLLRRALSSTDTNLVTEAIAALAAQHDEASLPAIEEALRRFPEQASTLALTLADFDSEAADRLALKYLDDDDREEYEQDRTDMKNGGGEAAIVSADS